MVRIFQDEKLIGSSSDVVKLYNYKLSNIDLVIYLVTEIYPIDLFAVFLAIKV